jgi:dienelactone hydrolase
MPSARWNRLGIAAVAAMTLAMAGTSGAAAAPDAEPPAAGTGSADARAGDVIVQDVLIPVDGQDPVAAWLVRPAKAERAASAGVVWLHWLGEIHADRTEFLAEAIDLADEGTVSLLPQGSFPWVGDPHGTDQDVVAVEAQRDAYRASLEWLKARRWVDPDRLAIVGHDYGAMYGSLLADADPDVTALVLAAPDATWGNWFATFWLQQLEGNVRTAYVAMFASLDPVNHADRLGSHVLLQWAGDDFYIPEEVRDAFAASAPDAQVKLYVGVDHEFTTRAQLDRDAFLRTELGLG